ncbi:MAG: hypothetical protein RL134_2271 [Actinomycetota bacterium]
MSTQAGAALLRLAAFGVAAILVGVVLAVFATGASTPDEGAGIATLQTAVFFFGPIAAIATLAFIVVLALTRPVSLAVRLRTARVVAIVYAIIAAGLAMVLASTWWGLLGGIASTVAAALAWWLLGRPDAASAA